MLANSLLSRSLLRRLAFPAASALVLGVLGACGPSADETASGSSAAAPTTAATAGGTGSTRCAETGQAPTAPPDGAVPKKSDASAVSAAVKATESLLSALGGQRSSALFEYTDLHAKRCSWSNFPDAIFGGRKGVRLGDLSEKQRDAAMAAVKAVLSPAGYTYVENALEGDNHIGEAAGGNEYGEDNYHLAVYGEPSETTPWTLQFGGHHIAVHVSVGGDALSVSPYFKGAQPLSYKVEGLTVEPMAAAADQMFGLFESLDDDSLAAAELPGSYDGLVMGPGHDTGFPASEGLAYTELSGAQKYEVRSVISDYVEDYAPSLALPLIDLYESKLDEVKIAWSTSIERESRAYMRIDGPRFWIEWANTTDPGSADIHYHTVYRDKLLDYGTGTGGA